MKCLNSRTASRRGSVLAFVLVAVVIFALLGTALLTVTYGVRTRAIRFKNETIAMLAAEAGYEQALFWMGQQRDILGNLNDPGSSGTLTFPPLNTSGIGSTCTYRILPHDYIGRPIFRIISEGFCGTARRTVDVLVVQKVSGWDMGMCRVPTGPSGTTSTGEVVFAQGEDIYMNIHINRLRPPHEAPDQDNADIYFSGTPIFPQGYTVEMGEDRYRTDGYDKYASIINSFQGGILFNQPDIRITDPCAITSKLNRFQASTLPAFRFDNVGKPRPQVDPGVTVAGATPMPAVQLEFSSDASGNSGQVKITNNCTVIGGKRADTRTRDYMVLDPATLTFTTYPIYAYHYRYDPADPCALAVTSQPYTVPVRDTYATQTFAGETFSCGQIFVDGNVIIGGDTPSVVGGKIVVVATGNIWIVNSLTVAGDHYANDPGLGPRNGMPILPGNENAIGLIARGVIKVVDPGMSVYGSSGNQGVGIAAAIPGPAGKKGNSLYQPIGSGAANSNVRSLPDPMVVEAAVTVGGGGWGAENVTRSDSGTYMGGGRKTSGSQDDLYLRGSICEVVRGIVGVVNTNGYIKHYYLDDRLLNGVLPGNIWLNGKFIPAPAGWQDYRDDVRAR
jgi:type II secretory pathway pseudopilin PulG